MIQQQQNQGQINADKFDPYLTWGLTTDLAGFSAPNDTNESLFLVAVERTDGGEDNPFKNEGADPDQDPVIGLRPVFGSKHLFVGNSGSKEKVIELATRTDLRVEFNMVKYSPDGTASGDERLYAPQPDIKGKAIAIIDFGCPFAHRQFLDAKSHFLASRVKYFWDQDADKTAHVFKGVDGSTEQKWFPVKDFRYGRETTAPVISKLLNSCINDAGELDEDEVYRKADYNTVDLPYSHGGAVMDLAVGSIASRIGQSDAASDANIIFVQLPKAMINDTTGGSMTVYIMDALRYIINKSDDVDQLVINLSYGATAGPHNGQTMLERAMDAFLVQARKEKPFRAIEIVLPAGNHHDANLHAKLKFKTGDSNTKALKWQIMPDDRTDSYLEIWSELKACANYSVSLISPSGVRIDAIRFGNDSSSNALTSKKLASVSRPSKYYREVEKRMTLIAIAPTHAQSWARAEHGVWSIEISPDGNDSFEIDAWIERDDPMSWERGQPQSHFIPDAPYQDASEIDELNADDLANDGVCYFSTNSKISNGEKTIVVGCYIAQPVTQSRSGAIKDFDLAAYSGAGPEHLPKGKQHWPDYIASTEQSRSLAGIEVSGNRTGTWYRLNGTSFAAPQICRYLVNQGTSWGVSALRPAITATSLLANRRGKSSPRLIS